MNSSMQLAVNTSAALLTGGLSSAMAGAGMVGKFAMATIAPKIGFVSYGITCGSDCNGRGVSISGAASILDSAGSLLTESGGSLLASKFTSNPVTIEAVGQAFGLVYSNVVGTTAGIIDKMGNSSSQNLPGPRAATEPKSLQLPNFISPAQLAAQGKS